ncbi:MAG: hypothetical protein QOJ89_4579 [bacterium]|jgi:hypothetical protein
MIVKRLLLIGLVAGAGAGTVAAVAIPQTTTSPATTTATAAAPPVTPSAVAVRRVGASRGNPRGSGYLRLRPTGRVRVAVTVADPRGGPAWAVRQFLAERIAPTGPDGRGGPQVVGHNRCVQLGRLDRGRFGWLTADGTFRPVAASVMTAAPTQCLSRRPDLAGHPFADVITTITEPRRAAAEPVQTIVYGLSGSAARGHRLTVGSAEAAIDHGAAGAMLAVLPAATHSATLRLSVRYPRRGSVTILPHGEPGGPLPARLANRIQRPVRSAASLLAAQAPDPDGGLPYGMTATAASDGAFCTSWGGRVVGDRVGGVDYDLDIMRENGGSRSGTCPATRAALRGQRLPDGRSLPPFQLGSSFGGGLGAEPGEDPRAGRIARRSAPGLVVYSGTADADVRYLTFATPSDVRTIAPSGPAHAFLIVYAGSFPTGATVVTTTFDDGHMRRDEMPNFGP